MNGGNFNMYNGTISGNQAPSGTGGGMDIFSGTFNLNSPATSGSIHSNTASTGPNVCNSGGIFLVNGVTGSDY